MRATFIPRLLPPSLPPGRGVSRSLQHGPRFAALRVVLFHAVGSWEKRLRSLVEPLKVFARRGWPEGHLFFVSSGYRTAAEVRSRRQQRSGAVELPCDRLRRIRNLPPVAA